MKQQKRTMKKIILILSIAAIAISLAFFNMVSAQTTQESSESKIVACVGGDITKLAETTVSRCSSYTSFFEESSKKYLGTDGLLLISLAQQESSCNPSPSGPTKDGGILQVDSACLEQKRCPTVDRQIEEGAKILQACYNAIKPYELSEEDETTIALFCYNRGLAKKTAELVKGGMPVSDAMVSACRSYFNGECRGGVTCKYDRDGNDKCTGLGPAYERTGIPRAYGANYPNAVLDTFTQVCTKIGGTVTGVVRTSLPTDETASAKKELPIGSYSVMPSFRIHVGFTLDKYEKLMQKANELLKTCESFEGTSDVCVAKNKGMLAVDGLVEKSECTTPEEELLYQLAETYETCYESPNRNCYCTLKIPTVAVTQESQRITVDLVPKGTSIEASAGDAKTIILAPGPYYGKEPGKKDTSPYTTHLGVDYENGAVKKAWITLEDYHLGVVDSSDTLSKSELKFYKESDGSVVLLHPAAYNLEGVAECKTPKEYFRFCFEEKQEVLAYDAKDKTTKKRPMQYRFALYIPNTRIPKEVSSVFLEDKKLAEESMVLGWALNNDESIAYYDIYCAKEPFSNSNNMNPTYRWTQEKKEATHAKVSLGLCTNEKIIDGQIYYVAVVAVDTSGNARTEVQTVSATSQDDLAPDSIAYGPQESTFYESSSPMISASGVRTYKISVKQETAVSFITAYPQRNYDESMIDDFSGMYKVCTSKNKAALENCQSLSSTPLSTPVLAIGDYFLTVLAQDEKGNVITDLEKTYEEATSTLSQRQELDSPPASPYDPPVDSLGVKI